MKIDSVSHKSKSNEITRFHLWSIYLDSIWVAVKFMASGPGNSIELILCSRGSSWSTFTAAVLMRSYEIQFHYSVWWFSQLFLRIHSKFLKFSRLTSSPSRLKVIMDCLFSLLSWVVLVLAIIRIRTVPALGWWLVLILCLACHDKFLFLSQIDVDWKYTNFEAIFSFCVSWFYLLSLWLMIFQLFSYM